MVELLFVECISTQGRYREVRAQICAHTHFLELWIQGVKVNWGVEKAMKGRKGEVLEGNVAQTSW
jgi:hypothetical protein